MLTLGLPQSWLSCGAHKHAGLVNTCAKRRQQRDIFSNQRDAQRFRCDVPTAKFPLPLSALTPSDVQAATKKTTVSINSAMLGTTQSVGSVWHTLEVGFLRLCPRATPAKLCAALHATSRTHRTTLRGNGPTYHFSSALGLVEVRPDTSATQMAALGCHARSVSKSGFLSHSLCQ